jgi:hypothetical protein
LTQFKKPTFSAYYSNGAPNYGEILSANKNSVEPPKLNELFKLKNDTEGNMVHSVDKRWSPLYPDIIRIYRAISANLADSEEV